MGLLDKSKYIKKEIHTLRLAITTSCILRCRFCFVRKNNKVMAFELAKTALGLFISSPGKNKLLIIYGGEPFLHFYLVEKIVLLAKRKACHLNKKIGFSLGTNGILLKQKQINFLHKNGVKIAISINGDEVTHNKNRIFKNGKGSFREIYRRLPMVFKNMPGEDVCALFGVYPEDAGKMFGNFVYLNGIGFNSINIEPMQNIKWHKGEIVAFLDNLRNISAHILGSIKKRKFIFINSINKKIAIRSPSELDKKICPFHQNLEIYPSGAIAFSPFLINAIDRDRYLIGDMERGFLGKFKECEFDLNKLRCKNCWGEYHGDGGNPPLTYDVIRLRDAYSIRMAEYICDMSRSEGVFKDYIREAKKRIFE